MAMQVLKCFRQEGLKAESVNRYLKLLTSHTVAAFLAKEYNNALDDVGFEGDRLEYVSDDKLHVWALLSML